MKAMTILTRCRNAEVDERRIRQRISQRRDAIACMTPRMNTVGGGRSTSEPDKIGAFVAVVTELEGRLKLRQQAHSVEIAAACTLLDTLPASESTILHEYYVKCGKVPSIAKRLGYSESYTRKLKSDAEKHLDEIPESVVTAALPAWYMQEYERKE